MLTEEGPLISRFAVVFTMIDEDCDGAAGAGKVDIWLTEGNSNVASI